MISNLVRPNIRALAPYSCARDEFKGGNDSTVFLDANESPYRHDVNAQSHTSSQGGALEGALEGASLNRYPDPLQLAVKEGISRLKDVPVDHIFLGNGSDEAIDLVFRIFCEPGKDNIVTLTPSYGMYEVCADINDVECRKVPLVTDGQTFSFRASDVLDACDVHTKAIFLCSPNNPTGNLLPRPEVERVLDAFPGIVVIDEAYGDFASEPSWRHSLEDYPRLIVLATFSKAWAAAGMRLGMAFASPEIIGYFNKVKYPYNVNALTQQQAIEILQQEELICKEINTILSERQRMAESLLQIPHVHHVFPSDANFLLVRVDDADKLYRQLADSNIVVRNRNNVVLCSGCLRITIGTPDENDALLQALRLI